MTAPKVSENLATVQTLLAGCPMRVDGFVASDTSARVSLILHTRSGEIHLCLDPHRPDQKAFARTRSFAISHEGGSLTAKQTAELSAFCRYLAARDRGGLSLREPPRKDVARFSEGTSGSAPPFQGRALQMVHGAGETSWSRETFDLRIERLRAQKGPFSTAILVVTQPCEMFCRFCPSGDLARAVPPELDQDKQYSDLAHQLRTARSLGVDRVEIGGNDVLAFPRVVSLLHAAGDMGFRHISAQSPGQKLKSPPFAEQIARSPLSQLDLPIYGATAEEHERITRVPGSFEGLLQAVDQLRIHGRPEVVLHTILLRSTLDRLDALLAFGELRFGLKIRLELLRPNRLGEREHLEDAASLEEIEEIGRRFPDHLGHDVPLCLHRPERGKAIARERAESGAFRRRLHLWDLGLRDGSEDTAPRDDRSAMFPMECNECSLRPGCPGVMRAYLTRFGAAALAPLSAEKIAGS